MINFGYSSLAHLVRHKAEVNGDKPLIFHPDGVLTYRDLDDLSNRLGNALHGLGVRPGDRAAILMWNDPWTLIVWLGLVKVGATVAFINPHYKGESLQQLLQRIAPEIVVMHADIEQDVLETPAAQAARIRLVQPLPRTIQAKPESANTLQDLAKAAAANPLDNTTSYADTAGMIHTSGTTGLPKFCVLSHNYYLAFGMIRIRQLGVTPDDRFHMSMPLYHSHKHLVTVLLSDTSVFLSPRFSASRYWHEVRDNKATILLIHDQPFVMLYKQPETDLDLAHGARLVFPGFRLQSQFHARFGVDVVSGLGSNESQTVALAPWYRPHVDPNYYMTESPGLEILSDYFDVRVVDDTDRELNRGEVGEVVSRQRHPHTQFEGYLGDPDKTAEVFRGGWYHHGDLGRLDENGLLHFAGRKAESIRHRGEWIPHELVENVVNAHPRVRASALVGVPSDLGDEDLKLYVVQDDSGLEPSDLLDYLSQSLAYFMIPRFVEFVDSLPRTAGLEKIAWRQLRDRGIGDSWDREKVGYTVKRTTPMK